MIDYREFTRRSLTVIVFIAVIALLALGVHRVSTLLVVLFTAWVIAVTLEVPVRWLQRIRVPRVPAVLISILGLLLIGGLFIALVLPPFIEQADALITGLPGAFERGVNNYAELRDQSAIAARLLPPFDMSSIEALLGEGALQGEGEPGAFNLAGIDVGQVASTALPVLGQIGNFVANALANLFLVALLALLLLLEPTIYYQTIVTLVPSSAEERAVEILSQIRKNVVRWLGAMLLSTAITSVLFLIVLGVILGLPNALALSLFAGAATFVPTFGPTIALIPVIVVAAAGGVNKLILATILYAAVGVVQDRVITPAIMKTELEIPAAALVMSQLILTVLIGPLGLLLAVPILSIIVTLVRELYVYDVLHKEGSLPEITVNRDGALTLMLLDEEEEGEAANGVQRQAADS